MTRTTIRAAVSAAVAAGLLGGVGASSASATDNDVCTRVFGSVQHLPALAYGDRYVAKVNAGSRFASGCYGIYPMAVAADAENLAGAGPWKRVGADAGWGYLYSTYRNGHGGEFSIATLLGDREPGGWHAVQGGIVRGTRGPVTAYTDRLVAAWEAGNRALALRYATPTAVRQLWNQDPSPTGWRHDALETGLRGNASTYLDHDGAKLTLVVDAKAAAAGEVAAVTQALVD